MRDKTSDKLRYMSVTQQYKYFERRAAADKHNGTKGERDCVFCKEKKKDDVMHYFPQERPTSSPGSPSEARPLAGCRWPFDRAV